MDFSEVDEIKNESMDTYPGEDSKDETIELDKEPKLVLERINVSENKVFGDWTDPRSIIEQVDEVMNEPLTSESDNDSVYEAGHSKPKHCRKCDKSYKTESAYKAHFKRYHPGKKRGVKPKEEVFNPWNVSNVDDFLHYCCPECDVRHDSKTLFINHAIDEHPKSRLFLSIFDLKPGNESNEFDQLDQFEDFDDTEMFEDDIEYSDDEMNNDDFIKVEEADTDIKEEEVNQIHQEEEVIEKEVKQEIVEVPTPRQAYQPLSKVACGRCNRVLKHEHGFLEHHKKHHGHEKPIRKDVPITEEEVKEESKVIDNESNKPKLKCDICGMDMKSSHTLRLHKMRHHTKIVKPEDCIVFEIKTENGIEEKIEKYKCDQCDKVFERKSNWSSHRKVHKGKKGRPAQFTKELEPQSGELKFRCSKCDMWFDNDYAWLTHRKLHEEAQESCLVKIKCFICHKEFEHEKFFSKHMKENHTLNNEYKCNICSKTFKAVNHHELEFHLTKEHCIGEFRYKCDICEKPFLNARFLKEHKALVHEGQKRKSMNLVCDICGKVLGSKEALKHHKRNQHTAQVINDIDIVKQCSKCSKEFNQPELFEDHLKLCLDEPPKDFKCKYCDLIWVSDLSLELHIAVQHQKLNHVCPICGNVFTTDAHKRYHIKHVHEKKFDYVCHLCAKPCAAKTDFKKHMAYQHGIGEKKHHCQHCPQKYVTANDLKRHVKEAHTKDTIYRCDQCPKTFWAKSYLYSHIRIVHKKVRPNKCDLCPEAYLYKRDLIKHKTNVHHIHV